MLRLFDQAQLFFAIHFNFVDKSEAIDTTGNNVQNKPICNETRNKL